MHSLWYRHFLIPHLVQPFAWLHSCIQFCCILGLFFTVISYRDKIFLPEEMQEVPKGARRDTNKRKAVGLLFPKKGGLAYAYLCYVSSVRDSRADQTDEKKQQPPLGQVTVVSLK